MPRQRLPYSGWPTCRLNAIGLSALFKIQRQAAAGLCLTAMCPICEQFNPFRPELEGYRQRGEGGEKMRQVAV